MPAWPELGNFPAFRLFDLVTGPAAGTRIASACASALVVRDSVLEVGFPGMSGTGRERAVSVADLDEVPKGVVWLVGVRLIAVVAFKGRHWQQVYGEVPAVRQGKGPGAVA